MKLRYVQSFPDRNGNMWHYFRRKGFSRVRLPGLPGTTEFMDAYQAALSGEPQKIGALDKNDRSINALIVSYYSTSGYRTLSDSTKTTYRGIIERFRAEHGEKGAATLQKHHIQNMLDGRSDTPSAANNLLRMLRLLMRHAVDVGWRKDDPTAGVRKLKIKSKGFTTWEESHIAQFMGHHEPGSKAHLALMLLLYTGQRRGDMIRMGWQNVEDKTISVVQQKTGQEVHIPIHADLWETIKELPVNSPAFLITNYGEPFTANGFGNWFRDQVREAGLIKGFSAHGLRKATCRRLAEAGCSANIIMSISGHRSLAEVERYTMAANRKNMARIGMESLNRTS